jgi:hypothetical protein
MYDIESDAFARRCAAARSTDALLRALGTDPAFAALARAFEGEGTGGDVLGRVAALVADAPRHDAALAAYAWATFLYAPWHAGRLLSLLTPLAAGHARGVAAVVREGLAAIERAVVLDG